MKIKNRAMGSWSVVFCLLTGLLLHADPDPKPSADALATTASSLKWQTQLVTLKDGLAKINLNDNFRFLDHDNSEKSPP